MKPEMFKAGLAAIVTLAVVGCGGPQAASSVSPSAASGPLLMDLTITGDEPFAGHTTNGFPSKTVPCGVTDTTFKVAEGSIVAAKRFQASWVVRVNGADYTMVFTRAPYRGPGAYTFSATSADQLSPRSRAASGGFAAYSGDPAFDPSTGHVVGDYTHAGGPAKNSAFTVAADERSGTIDLDIFTRASWTSDVPTPSGHISGGWRCA